MREAFLAKVVKQVCGTRTYWRKWAKDIADNARIVTKRINSAIKAPQIRAIFAKFLSGLRENLNPTIDAEEAVEMLAQHMITKPIFDALFADYEFVKHNRVSQNMEKMVQIFTKASRCRDQRFRRVLCHYPPQNRRY